LHEKLVRNEQLGEKAGMMVAKKPKPFASKKISTTFNFNNYSKCNFVTLQDVCFS
jgi:hypothetical protein